jgi:H+/Cl- antiporter ClcA
MTKQAVTRLFVGSIVAFVAAIVLGIAAVFAAFAGGAFQMDGNDVVGINNSAFTWTLFGLMIVAGLSLIGGAIGGLIAWIGALLNTVRLEDKMWFILLLVLGLLSFGFIAMVLYVLAGPDGTAEPAGTHDRAMHVGGAPA